MVSSQFLHIIVIIINIMAYKLFIVNYILFFLIISGGGYGNITSLSFWRRKQNVQNEPKHFFEDSLCQRGHG